MSSGDVRACALGVLRPYPGNRLRAHHDLVGPSVIDDETETVGDIPFICPSLTASTPFHGVSKSRTRSPAPAPQHRASLVSGTNATAASPEWSGPRRKGTRGPAPDPVHKRGWGPRRSSRRRAHRPSLPRGDSCRPHLLRPSLTPRARPAGPEQHPAMDACSCTTRARALDSRARRWGASAPGHDRPSPWALARNRAVTAGQMRSLALRRGVGPLRAGVSVSGKGTSR